MVRLGARILVAEDEKIIRTVLAEVLRDEGYHVAIAADGQECLDMLNGGELPDLFILDLMMPRVTGLQLIELLRSHPVLNGRPVLVITGTSHQDLLPGKGTVRHVFTKPFHLDEVLDAVHLALNGK